MSGRRLFYGLGGGLGHLTRTLALARRFPGDSSENLVLTNSPFAAVVAESGFELPSNLRVEVLSAKASKSELTEAVPRLVQRFQPDLLMVDTFPRGLVGELADIVSEQRTRQVFVHRYLNEDYIRQFELQSWVDLFDRILVPGESALFESHPRATRTEPWLLLDDDELLDRQDARQRWEVDERPLVLVSGCGRPNEVVAAREMAGTLSARFGTRANIRFASPNASSHWPLLQLLNGVDLLVGGGGYNTVHEARATGTALLALTQKRLYDCQNRRVCEPEQVRDENDLFVKVGGFLGNWSPDSQKCARYLNGATQAADIINQF